MKSSSSALKCVSNGPCRSSSGVAHEDRRLHFHKALSVQISPDRAENLRTLDKGIFYLRVHDQVHISLAIADIRVRQAVELLRKDLGGSWKAASHGMHGSRSLRSFVLNTSPTMPITSPHIQLLGIPYNSLLRHCPLPHRTGYFLSDPARCRRMPFP